MNADPVIAVIGSGALGSYYGGRLAQHGHRVQFLARSDYRHLRQHGLHVRSCDGDFALPPAQLNVYDNPKQMPPADLVIVALKTTANGSLPQLLAPIVGPHTILLTLQNGLGNEQLLAELFRPAQVLGGLAFVCINRVGPGEIDHTAHGLIQIGEPFGVAGTRLQELTNLFNRSRIQCQAIGDLNRARWEKLIWNVPFNGLGAALNLTTDYLVGNEAGLKLVRSLMEEIISTAALVGVDFDGPAMIEQKIRQTREMGAYKTSMQIDRQLGRKMEIDAIINRPLQIAKQHGLAVPTLEILSNALLAVDATSHAE